MDGSQTESGEGTPHLEHIQEHKKDQLKKDLREANVNIDDASEQGLLKIATNQFSLTEQTLDQKLADDSEHFEKEVLATESIKNISDLTHSVKYATNATKFAQAKADLFEEQAKVDALTGLGNKNAELLYFPKALEMILDKRVPLTKFKIDVDDLKKTNDTFGHPAGSALLQQVARHLQESLSNYSAHIFRVGGDEFDIYLENLPAEQAAEVAEIVRLSVYNNVLPSIQDKVPKRKDPFSVSIGVGTYNPNGKQLEDLTDIYGILDNSADIALYNSKFDVVNGKPVRIKNRVTTFREGMVRPVDPNDKSLLENEEKKGFGSKIKNITNTVLRRNKLAA